MRQEMGQDVDAACGQLAVEYKKKSDQHLHPFTNNNNKELEPEGNSRTPFAAAAHEHRDIEEVINSNVNSDHIRINSSDKKIEDIKSTVYGVENLYSESDDNLCGSDSSSHTIEGSQGSDTKQEPLNTMQIIGAGAVITGIALVGVVLYRAAINSKK
jgi:hypothetical protein